MFGTVLSLIDDVRRGHAAVTAGIRPHVMREIADALATRNWPALALVALRQMPRPYFDGEHGKWSADAIGIPEAALAMASSTQLNIMVAELKDSKAVHRAEALEVAAGLYGHVCKLFLQTLSKEAREGAAAYIKQFQFAAKPEVEGEGIMRSEAGQEALDDEIARWTGEGGKE